MSPLLSSGAKKRQLSPLRKFSQFWVDHLRQSVTSLGEMWRTRAASLMTIAVLGLSLTLPATFYVLVKNTHAVADNWQNASEISLFLKKDLPEKQRQQLVTRVGLYPEVDQLSYISPQAALDEFQQLSGFGNALQYLDKNPLPPVLLVIPTSKHSTTHLASELLAKLEDEREVEFGKLDIEWLQRLDAIIALFEDVVFSIAILLFLSVLLIVGNTIRLAILNKKTEIEVMKLVGATESFIQRPFLYTGVWYGIFGTGIAWLAIVLMIGWLEAAIAELAELYQKQISLVGLGFGDVVVLAMIAMLLGWCGSYIAVSRHIKDIEPE
jgi:cell division transport system permease protein